MNGKSIQKITEKGLFYVKHDGKSEFIDFELCFQNNFQKRTSKEALERVKEWNHMSDDDILNYIDRTREYRQIANRNYDGWPESDRPFIEFHTIPPTRFEFDSQQEFDEINRAIRKAGWRTFDIA